MGAAAESARCEEFGMRGTSLRPFAMLALRASTALALTLAPLQLGFEGALPKLSAAVALAGKKDGPDSRGGRDSRDGGHESKGGDAGNESGAGSEAGTSSKASGGEAGAGSNGEDKSDGNRRADDRDDGPRGKSDKADKGKNGRGNGGDKSTNPSKGTRVEIDGNNIRVIYPDGIKEEIDNGIYQMKDAAGRTIIKRRAKQADIDRLKAMAG
ncbi:hypothetical protein [Aminobacter sp. BE322]|uniref:hypothetical protein n=1 Tax=unclassified Aminobacter TaxID=2644704 RepID=UPI003D230E63